jgi:hypothetical protein
VLSKPLISFTGYFVNAQKTTEENLFLKILKNISENRFRGTI